MRGNLGEPSGRTGGGSHTGRAALHSGTQLSYISAVQSNRGGATMSAARADATITLRLPRALRERARRLRRRMGSSPLAAVGTVTESAVLKLALARGLDALEAEYR